MAGFLRNLFRMCPVLKDRVSCPAVLGFSGATEPVWRGVPGRFGRRARITTLCNLLLPADLLKGWPQKKEAPLPARIQINRPRQTRQDLNRSPKKPVQK